MVCIQPQIPNRTPPETIEAHPWVQTNDDGTRRAVNDARTDFVTSSPIGRQISLFFAILPLVIWKCYGTNKAARNTKAYCHHIKTEPLPNIDFTSISPAHHIILLYQLNMSKLLTVIGATGTQSGSVVAAALTSGNYKIRGVTRDVYSDASKALNPRVSGWLQLIGMTNKVLSKPSN
jgi:hypothetical protein